MSFLRARSLTSVWGLRHDGAERGDTIGSEKQVTPHTARHTMATLSLELGVDLVTVSKLLRQNSLNTTRKYIHSQNRT
jgi:site-specific recombinase XerD